MYLEVIYYRLEKTIFYSYWRHDCHFKWSFKPREGLAAYRAKEYLHFSVILRP